MICPCLYEISTTPRLEWFRADKLVSGGKKRKKMDSSHDPKRAGLLYGVGLQWYHRGPDHFPRDQWIFLTIITR